MVRGLNKTYPQERYEADGKVFYPQLFAMSSTGQLYPYYLPGHPQLPLDPTQLVNLCQAVCAGVLQDPRIHNAISQPAGLLPPLSSASSLTTTPSPLPPINFITNFEKSKSTDTPIHDTTTTPIKSKADDQISNSANEKRLASESSDHEINTGISMPVTSGMPSSVQTSTESLNLYPDSTKATEQENMIQSTHITLSPSTASANVTNEIPMTESSASNSVETTLNSIMNREATESTNAIRNMDANMETTIGTVAMTSSLLEYSTTNNQIVISTTTGNELLEISTLNTTETALYSHMTVLPITSTVAFDFPTINGQTIDASTVEYTPTLASPTTSTEPMFIPEEATISSVELTSSAESLTTSAELATSSTESITSFSDSTKTATESAAESTITSTVLTTLPPESEMSSTESTTSSTESTTTSSSETFYKSTESVPTSTESPTTLTESLGTQTVLTTSSPVLSSTLAESTTTSTESTTPYVAPAPGYEGALCVFIVKGKPTIGSC